jgi:hypothetical protein
MFLFSLYMTHSHVQFNLSFTQEFLKLGSFVWVKVLPTKKGWLVFQNILHFEKFRVIRLKLIIQIKEYVYWEKERKSLNIGQR